MGDLFFANTREKTTNIIRMGTLRYTRNSSQRGVATVEAALTIFAFFTLLFGIMEGSRLMGVQQTLTDAAREGARLSCAPDAGTTVLPTTSEVEAHVRDFLRGNAIIGATVNINQAVTDSEGRVYTRVQVSVPHKVIALQPILSGLEVTLAGASQMRNETSP